MPFFSIVLPVYNSESTLGRALDSVLTQDCSDCEIIIVNDGSSDGTVSAALDYAAKDARVRLYTIENSGPASARNYGMDKACGQYLLFLDGDDLLAESLLCHLRGQLGGSDIDMLIYGFTITDISLKPLMHYSMPNARYENRAALGRALPELYQANLLNQVWNKAYSLEWLRSTGVRFEDYRFAEDRLFVLAALRQARKVVTIKRIGCFYVNGGSGSLISRYYDKKFECCLLVNKEVCHLACELSNESRHAREVWDYMFFKTVVSCMTQLYHPTCPLKGRARRNALREILRHPNVRRKLYLNRDAGIHARLLYWVTRTQLLWLNAFAIRAVSYLGKMDMKGFIRLKHRRISDKV